MGIMQRIAILLQGLAERIEAFVGEHAWLKPEDIFVLSYDRPLGENPGVFAIYDPDCSWATGRNTLFESAKMTGRFHGFVFMDDDVAFNQGNMRQFVGLCLANPDLAIIPVTERVLIGNGVLDRKYQRPLIIDDQMYYLPAALIQTSGVYPLVTDYDHVSWWISCEISQQTLLRWHWAKCLQVNSIHIANLLHRAGTEGSNYRWSGLATVLHISQKHLCRERRPPPFYRSFERKPVGRLARKYWRLMRALRRLRARVPAHKIRQPLSIAEMSTRRVE